MGIGDGLRSRFHSRIGETGMCREAARLLNECNSAVVDASKAARKLAELAGTASGDTFIFLCNEKTRANARLKRMQAAYERHLTDHGCWVRSASKVR